MSNSPVRRLGRRAFLRGAGGIALALPMLEIFGSVSGRQFRFEWGFSKQHFFRATIEQLATSFADELTALIKSALLAESEYAEESYLTDFNWGQKELDRPSIDPLGPRTRCISLTPERMS